MHPLRVSDGDFDAMDFAFTLRDEFAGFTPKEVRRIAEQVPEDFYVSGGVMQPIPIPDPDCKLWSGMLYP